MVLAIQLGAALEFRAEIPETAATAEEVKAHSIADLQALGAAFDAALPANALDEREALHQAMADAHARLATLA